MKKTIRKITAALLALILCAGLLPVKALAAPAIEISVKYGFDNSARVGSKVPFAITLTNKGQDFNGYVQVIVPSDYLNRMVEKDISLPTGSSKTVTLYVPFETRAMNATIHVNNLKGKTVARHTVQIKIQSSLSSLNIGVLSDDFSALSYASMLHMYTVDNGNVNTKLIELSNETFPEDGSGFDMLDMILITNYSTDKLSDTQLKALNDWVKNGGALMIGTGSTLSKTLSGLKNLPAFAPLDLGSVSFTTHKTTYGLKTVDPKHYTPNDLYSQGGNSTYQYSLLMSFGNDVYTKVRDGIQATAAKMYEETKDSGEELDPMDVMKKYGEANSDYLWAMFGDYTGYIYTYQTAAESEKPIITEKFLEELYYQMLEPLCDDAVKAAGSGEEPEIQTDFSPVEAEIAHISVKIGHSSVNGDIKDSNSVYPLADRYEFGFGTVIVSSVDPTQNPLASYKHNSQVFQSILSQSLNDYFLARILNYRDKINYSYSRPNITGFSPNIYESLSSASAPPVLLYALVLIAYLVSIPVSYAILKKKRKNILFWITEAALALGFALLILLCSFTTKLRNAELRTARIIKLGGNSETVTLQSAFVMPKQKTYKFSADNSLGLDRCNYRRWYDNSTQDMDNFAFGVNRRQNDSTFIINNTTTLGYETLLGVSANTEKSGSFEVIFSGLDPVSVTNRSGYDLKHAFVTTPNICYFIGDIDNGQTVAIDQSTPQANSNRFAGYTYNYTQMLRDYMSRDSRVSALEFMFGGNASEYRKTMLRIDFANFCRDSHQMSLSTIVGGFMDTPSDEKIQTEKGYGEWSYTMVYQEIQSDAAQGLSPTVPVPEPYYK